MLEPLIQWTQQHRDWLSLFAAGSLLMLLATPVLVPLWISSLPENYFVRGRRGPRSTWERTRAAVATAVGGLLVLAGLAMLVLPGQGLLTLFVGLSLMHFPGKRKLQRRLLRRPHVAGGLQWMRRRTGRPPMQLP